MSTIPIQAELADRLIALTANRLPSGAQQTSGVDRPKLIAAA
jgi:hypothetical protein